METGSRPPGDAPKEVTYNLLPFTIVKGRGMGRDERVIVGEEFIR